jgi:predicted phage terminase large subunit-like protein
MSNIRKKLEIKARARQELNKRLYRKRCEDDFAFFVQKAWPAIEPAQPLMWGRAMDMVCRHLEALDAREVTRLIVNIPPGFSKPVWEEELIFTDHGYKKLKDIVVGDRVLTHKGRFRTVTAVHEQGKLPLKKVTTFAGREVITAPDHPFLTPNGWVNAENLVAGNYVGFPLIKEDFGDKSMSPEEARLLGYLVGDGTTTGRNLHLTNMDEEVIGDFIYCAKTLGFFAYAAKHNNPNVKAKRISLRSTEKKLSGKRKGGEELPVIKWIQSHGLYESNSYTKFIPEGVFRSGPEAISNFLGAYWSCDGTVSFRHVGNKTTMQASATTVSKRLAEDLQRALMAIGIGVRIRKHITNLKTIKQGDKYTSYNIQTSTRMGVAHIAKLKGLMSRKRILAENGFLDEFEKPIYEDEVISIEDAGKGLCRCLTVNEDSTFTVNGIIVHNSTLFGVMFPAWVFAKEPTAKILSVAHNLDLALRDSVRCRRLVTSEWYMDLWPHVRLSPDENAKGKFSIDGYGGFRQALAAGAITGVRADHVICLPYDAIIHTSVGKIKIGKIVNERMDIKIVGWMDGKLIWQDIEEYEVNPVRQIYKIKTLYKELECTEDHLIYTKNRGWIEARNVGLSDELCVAVDSNTRFLPFSVAYEEVISVEAILSDIDCTYNIRVSEAHNYFANGILVHNCDDPLSAMDAMSEAVRNSMKDWILEAVPTRLNNPGGERPSTISLVMQRLHEEDTTGVLLEKNLGYEHLMLPMEYEPGRHCSTSIGEDWRTEEGELLFPERFPREVVDRDKSAMGPWASSSQFQQAPSPRGGGLIKRDQFLLYDDELARAQGKTDASKYPDLDIIIASVDTAYTTKQENDASAITVWGVWQKGGAEARSLISSYADNSNVFDMNGKRIQMVDERDTIPCAMLMYAKELRVPLHGDEVQRMEGESPEAFRRRAESKWGLCEHITDICKRFNVDTILIEAKASGISVAQEIKRLNKLASWQVKLVNPGNLDKVARVYSVQPIFANGQVYSPDKDWAEKVIAQCETFPKGRRDDLVDTVSQALRYLRDNGFLARADEVGARVTGEYYVGGHKKKMWVYDV